MDENGEALEALYRRRYAAFRDVLSGVTGSSESSRDVVQEAFAIALRERRKFRGEGSLEAWVWRIAWRVAVKSKRDAYPLVADPSEAVDGSTAADSELRAAIRQLPPQRRLILFLRYFADMSYDEIAAACGIREGTVGASLTQARDELQSILTKEVEK